MCDTSIKQVIVVRKDLNMRKGKIAAQVAHASMKFLIANSYSDHTTRGEFVAAINDIEKNWLLYHMAKIVVYVESEQELLDLVQKGRANDIQTHTIIDAGKTEFNGVPTLTCAAFGPDRSSKIDKVTGHLKLL